MSGSKGLTPHELAHRWVKDLGTRPDMSIKVERMLHDMRILGRIVGVRSTEQSVGIKVMVVTSPYKSCQMFLRMQAFDVHVGMICMALNS